MNAERRSIFALLAMGRLSPREAERLLAASAASRESFWMAAAGAVSAGLAWAHDGLGLVLTLARTVFTGNPATVDAAHSLAARLLGGWV